MLDSLRSCAEDAPDGVRNLDLDASALFAARVEELSRTVEYLQIVAAGQLDRLRTQQDKPATRPAGWTTGWRDITPLSGDGSTSGAEKSNSPRTATSETARAGLAAEFRSSTEYLRVLLRIGAGEARRRLALAASLLPRTGITGQTMDPAHEHLAEALATGTISSRAATIITLTLDKTRHTTTVETRTTLEKDLVHTAEHHDPDFLTRIARRWADALDLDGAEPTEEELRHTQGAFLRKPKHGLNHLEIFATQTQYEHLLTVMNAATNPRTTPGPRPGAAGTGTVGTGAAGAGAAGATRPGTTGTDASYEMLDRRSRPQKLLDGLISACKAALTTGTLPTNGGHRPQITATINYEQLLEAFRAKTVGTGRTAASTGTFTFTGPVPAATLRTLACDADIIPAVLGGQGQILDIGRANRLFPPHLRKAITTRDQGCAFPGCTIPAPWCETHHITYWTHGGPTTIDNGTLLCSHHHHVIHKEQWRIRVEAGIPWFIPPPHIDPHQHPVRNHYFRC
ncbi:HNH endonuclease signature motif containing protein [Arthrobacter celericrescens]|uniref:HNH endonuclease signature motif containing protein n=1 Tax=Arthrobacter celericrescens TaxID=2320851 RepID=UPI001FE1FC3C|nr:HNH endonuclease signature motif containing protein [Arthrobacter celericrescens]